MNFGAAFAGRAHPTLTIVSVLSADRVKRIRASPSCPEGASGESRSATTFCTQREFYNDACISSSGKASAELAALASLSRFVVAHRARNRLCSDVVELVGTEFVHIPPVHKRIRISNP